MRSRTWIFAGTLGLAAIAANGQMPSLAALRGQESSFYPYLPAPEGVPSLPEPAVQFEAVVDTAYIVGPGDYLTVGYANKFATIPVDPEGLWIMENVPPVAVDGKRLSEVKALIKTAAGRAYRSDRVFVTLAKAKTLQVSVTGAVANPGFYGVGAAARLSEVVGQAGGFTLKATRRARVTGPGGGERLYDLMRYYRSRDLGQNPYLRQGDRIAVEEIDYAAGILELRENGSDRTVALVEGDDLDAVILRYDNFHGTRDWSYVKVHRGGRVVDSVGRAQAMAYRPRAGDVLEIHDRRGQVFVSGAVARPGPYDFNINFTPLDYVSLAGITQNTGNYRRLRVLDENGQERQVDASRDKLSPGDHVIIPESMEVRARDYIGIMLSVASLAVAIATFVTLSR